MLLIVPTPYTQYSLTGVLTISVVFAILSAAGLPFVLRLAGTSRKESGPPQFGILDILCLTLILALIMGFLRVGFLYPFNMIVYSIVLSLIGTFWWCVVVVLVSRIRDVTPTRRAMYEVFVVPCGFLALPLMAGYVISLSQTVGFDGIRQELPSVAVGVGAYLACWPVTSWVLDTDPVQDHD